jgi:hypothetical protein
VINLQGVLPLHSFVTALEVLQTHLLIWGVTRSIEFRMVFLHSKMWGTFGLPESTVTSKPVGLKTVDFTES